MIAVSLNVGGGGPPYQTGKTVYMCMQNTPHTEVMCLLWLQARDGGLIKQAQLKQKKTFESLSSL